MKYLKTSLIYILNGVRLPTGIQHDIAYEISERVQNNNCCCYIYEHESMKMDALNCMIKYLPCFVVNFQAATDANLLLAKCS